jgi:molecular chaperone DnaK
VTFDIDSNGILKVSAKDLDTGKEQSITITADDRMSDAEIEQAIKDAQQYAGWDNLRTDALELTGEAQSVLSQTQQALKKGGKQIDKAEKKQIQKDCKALEKLLVSFRVDKVTEKEMENIRLAKQQLESSGARIRELYNS